MYVVTYTTIICIMLRYLTIHWVVQLNSRLFRSSIDQHRFQPYHKSELSVNANFVWNHNLLVGYFLKQATTLNMEICRQINIAGQYDTTIVPTRANPKYCRCNSHHSDTLICTTARNMSMYIRQWCRVVGILSRLVVTIKRMVKNS